MRPSSVSLALVLALGTTGRLAATDWDLPSLMEGRVPAYTVRRGHPRLFITPDNKDDIVERITGSALGREAFQGLINIANDAMGTDFGAILDGNPRSVYERFLPRIEALGVIYQLGEVTGFRFAHSREAYGRKGVEALTALAALEQGAIGSEYRRFTALAVGYDWLFDLLTREQRVRVVARLIDTVRIWPVIDTPLRQQNREGMASACPIGMEIINPLAFYGDGIEDARAREMVDGLLSQTLWGPLGGLTRLEFLLHNGVVDEEIVYAKRYWRFVPALEAWYTATGQDLFQAGSFWRELVKWFIHNTLPHSGTGTAPHYFVKMQQYYDDSNLGQFDYKAILASATSYLDRMGEGRLADLARWAVELPGPRFAEDSFFYIVLLGNPLRTPRSPADLGLSTFHAARGSMSRVYMRSRWGSADATYLAFAVDELPCLRGSAQSMNTFFLWKNGGPLLTHKNGYAHDYFERIPDFRFNTVDLYEPGEYPNALPSTAGGIYQTTSCDRRWIDVTRFHGTDGRLRGAIAVPGKFGYTAGDVSAFLRNRSRGAVESSDRQLVWFQASSETASDYLLLFDRVKTNGTTVQPHLTFNTAAEPQVSRSFGEAIEGTRRTQGHWLVRDAACVTVTNESEYEGGRPRAHGRLFAQVLLPRQVNIYRLGGMGGQTRAVWEREEDVTYGMDVNGTVWNLARADAVGMDGDVGKLTGRWRFHVVNQELAPDNLYLIAMEATDSSRARPSGRLELLEGQGLLAGRVADCLGVFNPLLAPLARGSLRFPSGSSGTYRILIGDVQAGSRYRVSVGNADRTETASTEGCIFLEGIQVRDGDTLGLERLGGDAAPAAPRGVQVSQ